MGVTMRDIAVRVGTSASVVSVALNGARSKTIGVSPETRDRILRAAQELGYSRDMRASSLAGRRNQMIGLMLPHLSSFSSPDPFYSLVTAGVCGATAANGFNLVMYTSVSEEDGPKAIATIDRRIDGLILVMPPDGTPIIKECQRLGINTVAVLKAPESAQFTINSDDYKGGRIATEHLLGLGHTRIAHLHGNPDFHTSEPRYRGYVDAMSEAGLKVNPNLVRDGHFQRAAGYSSTMDMMTREERSRPSAIFAANDVSAHGAIDALNELGLSVPGDVSVLGYDDTWYAGFVQPALTTVNMNVDLVGRRAAQLLIDSLDGIVEEAHPILPVSLTIRVSTGPAKSL
jgi:DNA-binding LacI/PurR family transcriptional regulator